MTSPFQDSDINDVDSFLDDLCSILSEDMQSSTSAPQAVAAPPSASAPQAVPGSVPSQQLMSPERAMTRYPGKDLQTFRNLAVALARDCVFGPQVMLKSTHSGRGKSQKKQLDLEKMQYVIAGRAEKNPNDPEFELMWNKFL